MTFRLSQQRLSFRGLAAALSLLAISASVHATQTVDPTLTVGGASINGSTQAVPAGSTFSFFGMYTDNSTGPESGLGLKVKYNPMHLTNLTISEEYTKCRIAAAQVQPLTSTTAQVVMGWVDTSVRSAGAVGWPDLADTTAAGANPTCLNPGAINTDTAAGTATAPGQKLFKVTATMAAACTSAGACTSTVLLDSEGNFSYAPTSGAGFTNKSFTINGASAPTLALAATNPVVSRKTHDAAGVFDIPIDTSQAIGGSLVTVEPRAIGGGHLIVFTFNTAIAGVGNGSSGVAAVQTAAAASAGTANAVVVGNTVQVTLTGVADTQRLNVSLTNVANTGVNVVVPIAFLLGDVNGTNGSYLVTGTDVNAVKGGAALASTIPTAANFKLDVNADGNISGTDVNVVKGRAAASSGTPL